MLPSMSSSGAKATTLVSVAKRIAFASFVGPCQAARSRGTPGGDLPIDGVAGHDRIVDQQPERDDQRGDRHLLQVDAQQPHHAEGHRQRERNAGGDQQRASPFHEEQRDGDDDRDGLSERCA